MPEEERSNRRVGRVGSKRDNRLPRINFRVFLFCALGTVFSVFFYLRIRFGGLVPSDFLFLLLFFVPALFPFSGKRMLALFLCVLLFGALGLGSIHLYTERFLGGKEEGDYAVSGMVCSFTVHNGYSEVILTDLSFDGEPVGGKLGGQIESEEVRAGDIVLFETHVVRCEVGERNDSFFYNDIRYRVGTVAYQKTGQTKNPFVLLPGRLYDVLRKGMGGGAEADVAFALLTGNSHGMDRGLSDTVRTGGVAHIFAVSGLHIGILFAAVLFLFRPLLGRKAVIPAVALAFAYTALCGFTVSSVRALVMCTVLGSYRAIGRKYDFLQSISLAALLLLLFAPADFLSPGFRLSFGACIGLALFSGSLSRLLGKIPHMPRFLSGYLSAAVSVAVFSFPILMECFGYVSLWGLLLNLFLIPVLPVFFLTLLLCAAAALCIPAAAGVLLFPAETLMSLFLLLMSADFSFVLKGFTLGAGAAVWIAGCVLLSERFRMRVPLRIAAACLFAAVFSLAVLFENVPLAGGTVRVFGDGDHMAAVIETRSVHVLVIDGEINAREIGDVLCRTHAGKLDAVFVVSDDESDGLSRAAKLDTAAVCAKDEIPTGLTDTPLVFGEETEVGGLVFRYLSRSVLTLFAEGVAITIDFENSFQTEDFSLKPWSWGLKFSFEHGIIKEL